MTTVAEAAELLERIAPTRLAEDWDNVGLLVGDRSASINRLMTCLTVTPASVAEAIDRSANLVVSHHPAPFRPLKRLTTDMVAADLVVQLIRNGVAVYSPHTAFDSAAAGVNQQLADGLGLRDAKPLLPSSADPAVGAGRAAVAPDGLTFGGLADAARQMLNLPPLRGVGAAAQPVTRVGIACGSGASLLDAAIDAGCDAFVTGEASFHSCLEAESRGVAMLLLGHYASERFAVEALADELAAGLPGVKVWCSEAENDPVATIEPSVGQ